MPDMACYDTVKVHRG